MFAVQRPRGWRSSGKGCCLLALLLFGMLAPPASGQFTSGSDGSDGVFNPLVDTEVDMADHPDGVYQYASVNIPAGVTVTFLRNAANTPVTWLVQTTCLIDGIVSLDGQDATPGNGPGEGGPGGFRGGQAALAFPGGADPGPGGGPGGGNVTPGLSAHGANASYGSVGVQTSFTYHPVGATYGNEFILPLIGGSGGSGGSGTDTTDGGSGGGGGGAILIAADESITVNGTLRADGGDGFNSTGNDGGGGSGGALRLLAPLVTVSGTVSVLGGNHFITASARGGQGRIRFDGSVVDLQASSTRVGISSQGSLGIVMLPANVGPQLQITTVGGVAVTIPTSGNYNPLVPNVEVPPELNNPIDVVVAAANIPVGTTINVVVRPQIGAVATFNNVNSGTFESSSATVPVNLSTGDGTLHATATIAGPKSLDPKTASLWDTGLAPNGERFVRIEVAAAMGGEQRTVYITESGERFPFPPLVVAP